MVIYLKSTISILEIRGADSDRNVVFRRSDLIRERVVIIKKKKNKTGVKSEWRETQLILDTPTGRNLDLAKKVATQIRGGRGASAS